MTHPLGLQIKMYTHSVSVSVIVNLQSASLKESVKFLPKRKCPLQQLLKTIVLFLSQPDFKMSIAKIVAISSVVNKHVTTCEEHQRWATLWIRRNRTADRGSASRYPWSRWSTTSRCHWGAPLESTCPRRQSSADVSRAASTDDFMFRIKEVDQPSLPTKVAVCAFRKLVESCHHQS